MAVRHVESCSVMTTPTDVMVSYLAAMFVVVSWLQLVRRNAGRCLLALHMKK